MRVCSPAMWLDRTASSSNCRVAGAVRAKNCQVYPAARNGVRSAPRRSWDRFTTTISPAENGRVRTYATDRLPSPKTKLPGALPLERPNTRTLAWVTEDGSRGRSNEIDTTLWTSAITLGDGLTAVTWSCAAAGL